MAALGSDRKPRLSVTVIETAAPSLWDGFAVAIVK
jgi:hypothetical protein